MQRSEDSRPTEPAPAKSSRKRAGSKGAPPPQGDTLGALDAEAAPGAGKPRDKGAKPAKAPARKATTRKAPVQEAPARERTEPLNFRVTAEFRRAFKRAAAAQDCKKVELLERVFNEWNARNPA